MSSTPHLCHYTVKAEDEWLVLSSDGLYQFMGLQDVAASLAWGEGSEPLSHPAEVLAREALLRAAEHAGEGGRWGGGGVGVGVGEDEGCQLAVQEGSR